MASIFIVELREVQGTPGGSAQIALMPEVAEQVVSVSTGSLASAAFNASTKFIRVNAAAICSLKFGSSPTATVTSATRMVDGQTEYFGVQPGQKVAVIANT